MILLVGVGIARSPLDRREGRRTPPLWRFPAPMSTAGKGGGAGAETLDPALRTGSGG
jgi:hypothetical protein